jgi:hypothetical protein
MNLFIPTSSPVLSLPLVWKHQMNRKLTYVKNDQLPPTPSTTTLDICLPRESESAPFWSEVPPLPTKRPNPTQHLNSTPQSVRQKQRKTVTSSTILASVRFDYDTPPANLQLPSIFCSHHTCFFVAKKRKKDRREFIASLASLPTLTTTTALRSCPLHLASPHCAPSTLQCFAPPRSPNFLHLRRPPLNPLALTAHLNINLPLPLHPPNALHERVIRHATSISPFSGHQLQHRQQELPDPLRLLNSKVVLLTQNVGKRPVA